MSSAVVKQNHSEKDGVQMEFTHWGGKSHNKILTCEYYRSGLRCLSQCWKEQVLALKYSMQSGFI